MKKPFSGKVPQLILSPIVATAKWDVKNLFLASRNSMSNLG